MPSLFTSIRTHLEISRRIMHTSGAIDGNAPFWRILNPVVVARMFTGFAIVPGGVHGHGDASTGDTSGSGDSSCPPALTTERIFKWPRKKISSDAVSREHAGT